MFEFNTLKIPQRRFSSQGSKGAAYRVYKNAAEFDVVEAETVTEAIEKSGIEEPYKITKICSSENNVISPSELEPVEEEPEVQEAVASEAENA